ncbi:restriction endonuclease subunit S [Microbacterium maritypicum]
MTELALKFVAKIVAGQSPESDAVSPLEAGLPFLQGNAEFGSTSPTARWETAAAPKRAEPGDILVSVRAPVGAVNIADVKYGIGRGLCAVRPTIGHSRFFYWWLLSCSEHLNSVATGSTFTAISASDIGDLRISVVDSGEQRAISDFLDRETAEIDAFIADQEELIGLLTERRDASWQSAIDSLSATEVPLRRIVDSVVDGPFGSSLTAAHYSESGARVIRLGNIGVNAFKDLDQAFIPMAYFAELGAHSVRGGDVVVAGLGDDRMPLGRAAVVPELGPAIVKADCYRVRPNRLATSSFLAWVLSAPQTRARFGLMSRGSTRQRLNTSVVRDVLVPLPSIPEQERVVAETDEVIRELDATIADAREAITLSKERRAALISAAVTGKIDVRGLA